MASGANPHMRKLNRVVREEALDGSGDRLVVPEPEGAEGAGPFSLISKDPCIAEVGPVQVQGMTFEVTKRSSSQDENDKENGEHHEMPQGTPGLPFRMGHHSGWTTKGYSYPLIYCSPEGTMSLMLRAQILVEMTVDRTIRAICPGKFAAAGNARANSSCIVHPQARVYQEDAKVLASFTDEKQAVIGAEGIVFTMKALPHVYLVSSQKADGTLPFPKQAVKFPELPRDATLSLFYRSAYGPQLYNECFKIVQKAQYDQSRDGTLQMQVNGITIRQFPDNSVEIMVRPRYITLNPTAETVSIRTHYVHMGVQEGDIAFIKRGVKRVHVSPSGMVISDGNRTTSLDYMGRIVAAS